MVAVLALVLALRIEPGWGLVFERDSDHIPDIWLARADGRDARRILQSAMSPKWSPDGKEIAYIAAGGVFTYTVATRKVRKVYTDPNNEPEDAPRPHQSIEWDPIGPRLLLNTARSKSIHVINVKTGDEFDWESPTPWPLEMDSAAWSPDRQFLAFTGNGDVWLGCRDLKDLPVPADPSDPKQHIYWRDYLLYVNRLAAIATFREYPHSSSLSGQSLAGDLAWSPNGDRIYFDYAGKRGVLDIGYLSLRKSDQTSMLDNGSGFGVTAHWLHLKHCFSPRVRPDGRSVAFIKRDFPNESYSVWISDPEGHHAHLLLPNADDFDWKP